jgi:glutamine amidotransferase
MHALSNLGVEPVLSGDHALIREADRVILPGVGAFGRAAQRLRELGLDDILKDFIRTERPFLGICVGMQLLMRQGFEFGTHDGLDIIPGTVEKIDICGDDGKKIRVPLIGWYPLSPAKEPSSKAYQSTPLAAVPADAAFYFVHSFSVHPDDSDTVLANAMHSGQPITAAVHRDNVIGLQFHPERSGEVGLSLLARFLNL